MIEKIIRTQDGKPAIAVGGGAFTKTYQFKTVLGSDGKTKPALFIKQAGDRACKLDQALVMIAPGDIIIRGIGKLPINPANLDQSIEALRIDDIGLTIADVTPIPFRADHIPDSVITGAQIYHNRDGSYFSGDVNHE